MKQSPELELIQANMMPGALSAHGFIGQDSRKLADILHTDAKSLEKTGITKEALAEKMQELTDYGMRGLGTPMPVDDIFEVEVGDYRGKLPCPFKDNAKIDKRQTVVRRLDTGVIIRWTDLNIHMIKEHGFFEGYGSVYRLDPVELARFLGIA
ncbi:MAG: hypothetical protein JXN65_02565 [Clostridia bacterium]|nr:hypothetical protein [Clostridia bacterium]